MFFYEFLYGLNSAFVGARPFGRNVDAVKHLAVRAKLGETALDAPPIVLKRQVEHVALLHGMAEEIATAGDGDAQLLREKCLAALRRPDEQVRAEGKQSFDEKMQGG